MNTAEGNKLIAEFDGYVRRPMGWFTKDGVNLIHIDAFKYHERWDELMPIIETMAKLKLKYANADEEYSPYPNTFGMVDEEGNYMVRIFCGQLSHAKTLIEAAWLAVVDFLESYNKELLKL